MRATSGRRSGTGTDAGTGTTTGGGAATAANTQTDSQDLIAAPRVRIGVDLGGTKISAIAMDAADAVMAQGRVATPRDDYAATIQAIVGLVDDVARAAARDIIPAGRPATTVGVGMPGAIAPRTGLVQNANSTWLNDRAFADDLGAALQGALGVSVRLANDADCFALSEAEDGAAAGAERVFGVILGTGCGGGIVTGGERHAGPRAIAGEWGHMPLPWPAADEWPGPPCWCGRRGCMETWVSGPGLAADFARATDASPNAAAVASLSGTEVAEAASAGSPAAQRALARHADRLARGLAVVVNILDPDVIVLGGGLSRLAHLYRDLPGLMAPHIFAADTAVDVRPPRWGDDSGVRGAARLWRLNEHG